jgi:hypothetical protein
VSSSLENAFVAIPASGAEGLSVGQLRVIVSETAPVNGWRIVQQTAAPHFAYPLGTTPLQTVWTSQNRGWAHLISGNRSLLALHTNRLAAVETHGVFAQVQLARIRHLSATLSAYVQDRFGSRANQDWTHAYFELREQIAYSRVGLNEEWVRATEYWLKCDAQLAVELLITQALWATSEQEAALATKLSMVTRLMSLLRRALSRIYQVGNLISSQRRWYLHHGSHPNGACTLGCFSWVCFQPA